MHHVGDAATLTNVSNSSTHQQPPAIVRAIGKLGGVANLATAIGVSATAPSMWKARGSVPPQHCAQIELATAGEVTRRDLRPADWHRIWPELVTSEHPAPAASELPQAA